jgi:putative tricarboxylic transport membrane protein
MKTDQFNGVLFLLISVLICMGSLRLPYGNVHNPGPGFLPFWLGVILGLLSIILLITTMLRRKEAMLFRQVLTEKIRWGKVLIALVTLILYGVLLEYVGFLLLTFFFLGCLIRFVDPQPWKKVIGWALVGSVGAYLIFEVWMKLRLPGGFLGV